MKAAVIDLAFERVMRRQRMPPDECVELTILGFETSVEGERLARECPFVLNATRELMEKAWTELACARASIPLGDECLNALYDERSRQLLDLRRRLGRLLAAKAPQVKEQPVECQVIDLADLLSRSIKGAGKPGPARAKEPRS